jgi:Fur family ferric uptake transcriptional regulator
MGRRSRDNADWREHAQSVLSLEGHRGGGARAAVIDLLAGQDCCLTAQEIFDELREDGRAIGIASVYRALELLSRLGLVRRLEIGSSACYEPERPGGEHHHHVVCEQCGRVEPFEDPGLERAIGRLQGRVGFEVSEHEVVLRGRCPRCA